MSTNTKIEWTDATWNPLRGCSRVSAGCVNCYAEGVAHRFGGPGQPYEGLTTNGRWNGTVRVVEKHLDDPLRWTKPRKVFVNSMSDLFHESVPDATIDIIFAVMATAHRHTFQVLTKRAERMHAYLNHPDLKQRIAEACKALSKTIDLPRHNRGWKIAAGWDAWAAGNNLEVGPPDWPGWPLDNVWIGVTVENQAAADERIPLLLQASAAVRFLSCEPLLGPVDLSPWLGRYDCNKCGYRGFDVHPKAYCDKCDELYEGEECPVHGATHDDMVCPKCEASEHSGFGFADTNMTLYPRLHWVIVGGESGPNARPMHPDWARSLRDQCQESWGATGDLGAVFFFKQWGEWTPGENDPNPMTARATAKWWDDSWSYSHVAAGVPEHIDDEPDLYRVGKKAAGRQLNGRTWNEFPEGR